VFDETKQGLGRRDDVAGRADRRGHRPGGAFDRSGNRVDSVADRDGTIRRKEPPAYCVHSARAEDPFLERDVPRPTVEHFDESTEDHEARVAVRPTFTDRVQQAGSGHRRLDVLRDTVVLRAGIGEVVGCVEAARVGEQMSDRHLVRRVGVRQPELRDTRVHGIVELDVASRDMLQNEGGNEHFRDRADLEQPSGIGRSGGVACLGSDRERAVRAVPRDGDHRARATTFTEHGGDNLIEVPARHARERTDASKRCRQTMRESR